MNNPKPVDLRGTEHRVDTALGSLDICGSSFASGLTCSPGQESGGSEPLLFQDKARAPTEEVSASLGCFRWTQLWNVCF